MESSQKNPRLRAIVRWGLYPFSWAVILLGVFLILTTNHDNKVIWALCMGPLGLLYLGLEWLIPYEERWSMSVSSMISDVKFMLVNGPIVAGFQALLAFWTISLSAENQGLATDWPVCLQLLLCLLIFEALNYASHRAMHETGGALGRFLWKTHAAHHLPKRLYLIMHAVFHPLNGLFVRVCVVIVPIWLMGYSQDVTTMFLMITGLHGTISHFNVDIRMAWMNYLFVGPELHRYHHSADEKEAKNYGSTLSLFDLLFGTFVYRPGIAPRELGVPASSGLPTYDQTLKVLILPFTSH